jgi:hypothetical protein
LNAEREKTEIPWRLEKKDGSHGIFVYTRGNSGGESDWVTRPRERCMLFFSGAIFGAVQ